MPTTNNKTTAAGKLSPFDFLKSINDTKVNLICEDAENAKYYNSYVINRSLSYLPDTIYFANEMNKFHHIDPELQYSFLINIVRKRKRFSKWDKPQQINNISIIKRYFGYSEEKCRQVVDLFTPDQIESLNNKVSVGGRQ